MKVVFFFFSKCFRTEVTACFSLCFTSLCTNYYFCRFCTSLASNIFHFLIWFIYLFGHRSRIDSFPFVHSLPKGPQQRVLARLLLKAQIPSSTPCVWQGTKQTGHLLLPSQAHEQTAAAITINALTPSKHYATPYTQTISSSFKNT